MRGRVTGQRADDDQRALALLEHGVELVRTVHQAVEVDIHHMAEPFGFELITPVTNNALAQHQHIQRIKTGLQGSDFIAAGHIAPGVMQPLQV
jgi:hypothetical protein